MREITYPICCDVPMWLVTIELGDLADHQHFECKVCDAVTRSTVPHRVPDAGNVEPTLGCYIVGSLKPASDHRVGQLWVTIYSDCWT